MSMFKRAPVVGGQARQDVLTPLRMAQIVSSKPVLPAEILSTILDFLPVPDLIRFAQCSKRMREMVYDDTRWVQRLQLIGCWNELDARTRAEVARRKTADAQQDHREEAGKRVGIGVDTSPDANTNVENPGRSSTTIFDARWQEAELHRSGSNRTKGRESDLNDGFEAVSLSPSGNKNPPSPHRPQNTSSPLNILSQVQSVRGLARREYGKIYGVLAPFYDDAVRCKMHTDAKVFRTYRDPDQQAQMLSQLGRFSHSDISQGWRQRQEKLQSVTDAFEDAVSREFDQALEIGDVDGRLRKYAHVLVSLNGGLRGVESFITKSPCIDGKQMFGDPMDCLESSGVGAISFDKSQAFFQQLSIAFNEQIAIIDQVFPPSVNVVIPFLRRIGKDVVAEYLTVLFDESHETSIESYLKAVSATYEQSLDFAKSLRPTQGSGDEFYDTVDQIISNVFEPHLDLYLQEEMEFFKQRSDAEVGDWERQLSEQDASMASMYMSNVHRQADKRDFLTSFKKVVMMPVNVLPTFPMSSPFSGKPATAKALVNGETLETLQPSPSETSTRPSTPSLSNNPALTINRAATPLSDPPTTELAAKAAIMNSRLEGIRSLFSIEVALNLVHNAKSSIERAAVFVKLGSHFSGDVRKQCEGIFILLLQILGTRHIKAGFDQAVDHLSKYNPRETGEHSEPGVTPLIIFLELVNVGDLIQQMLDVFYEQELIATKLTDRSDFLDPAVKEKKRFEQMLDERVAAGLNSGIEALMAEVEFVCATTQLVEDFNPGVSGDANNSASNIGPSRTAKQVVEVVSSHTKMLIGSTDKNMLDVFNQEVGLRLFTALCKHLKRQRVSVDGSIKLICDMNHYFMYVQTLKNQNLLQYFVALRELVQIYLIDPSDAKELATIIADGDRFKGIFRAEEVYEFAERRADWYQIKRRVERAMYGIGCLVM